MDARFYRPEQSIYLRLGEWSIFISVLTLMPYWSCKLQSHGRDDLGDLNHLNNDPGRSTVILYDSVVDKVKSPNMYVVQCYPDYLITFT